MIHPEVPLYEQAIALVAEGAKALHVSAKFGLPEDKLRRMARARGITLKRGPKAISVKSGRSPDAYREKFEKRFGLGSAGHFIDLCRTHAYELVGEQWGAKYYGRTISREAVRQFFNNLTGGEGKLSPMARRTITRSELVRASRGARSKAEVMERLGIHLRKLNTYARRSHIFLPDWEAHQRQKVKRLCKRIKFLAKQGLDCKTIAKRVRRCTNWVYGLDRKHHLGVPRKRRSRPK